MSDHTMNVGMSRLDQWYLDNQEIVDGLKSQYPRIEFAEYDGVDQVFGIIPASAPQMNIFTQASSEKEQRYAATYNLVAQCVKYPAAQQLHALLQENAGLIYPVFADIAEMSKLTSEGRRKKF